MFNKISKNLTEVHNLWVITIPTIILGCISTYYFISEFDITKLLYFLLGYFFINIVGVTLGLHRYFSHKSFKTNKWIERLFLLCSTWSGQGSPVWWVALHRGYHHRSSDTLKDFHSPLHGFWHSFILWMFRIKPDAVSFRYSVDMLKNKEVVWVSTHYTKIWLISNLIFILIDTNLFLYFSMMASFITLITYNITNSLNHWRSLGYTNFQTKDNSTNVPWLFFLVLGECWHNNHHARPGNYYFGQKWWEIDPAGTLIHFIKK